MSGIDTFLRNINVDATNCIAYYVRVFVWNNEWRCV